MVGGMVVVLARDITAKQKNAVRTHLEALRFQVQEIEEEDGTVFGAVGAEEQDLREVEQLPGVTKLVPLTKPYKLASRELRKQDSVVDLGPVRIGGGRLTVVAGPCAVESREQIRDVAAQLADSGAAALRGGAFKLRTSPYSFQGMGVDGLELLREAGDRVRLPVVSELTSPDHLAPFAEMVDMVQIGARNMQNYELLKRVGECGKPVLLKRGLAATIEELLMSAEYLLAHGTSAVVLCERGIRTFETSTRNTLDLSAIPVVKKLSHLPILVDPSHGTGSRDKVAPMALAGLAAGADGLIVEVHTDPEHALSDGPQSLFPQQFEKMMRDIDRFAAVLEKQVERPPRAPRGASPPAVTEPGLRVAFQGERGAHSEHALRHHFAEPEPVPSREFADVFRQVLAGEVDYGVLPVENSLSGSIHENYDLLLQFPDVHIVGELRARIEWCLIGTPDADLAAIARLISHPQGLAQCARFLESYPDWERVAYYDTAGAVAKVASDGDSAQVALASPAAAAEYGMRVLAEGVETNAQNYTRFVVLASARHDPSEGAAPDRASIVFSALDEPGSLFRALQVLADRELNMTKLESRPIPGRPWEYMFYVDLDLDEVAAFETAMEELRDLTASYRLLGLYPGARHSHTPA